MSGTYNGVASNFNPSGGTSITEPADGDALAAASVRVGLEKLTDIAESLRELLRYETAPGNYALKFKYKVAANEYVRVYSSTTGIQIVTGAEWADGSPGHWTLDAGAPSSTAFRYVFSDTAFLMQGYAGASPFVDGAWDSVTLINSTGLSQAVGDVIATNHVTAGAGVTATTGGVLASAGNIVATLGNITASAGNIAATAGSVSAGTTVTGGTGVTATTGNVTATAGAVSAGTTVTAATEARGNKIRCTSAAPAQTFSTGAGSTAPTSVTVAGTNMGGTIAFTTSAVPAAGQRIFDLTWDGGNFSSAPTAMVMPDNTAAWKLYSAASTTGDEPFVIATGVDKISFNSGNIALTAATAYKFRWVVG